MADTLRIGVAQMTSTNRHEGNIATMKALADKAKARKCQMLALPEVAGMMNRRIAAEPELTRPAESDPFILACQDVARKLGLWIHTGSTLVRSAGETRLFNHSDLIDHRGRIVATYDKIHLFDYFPSDGKPIEESKRIAPGKKAVLADTPWGPMGMSVCYDLRFPHLYRGYAKGGARLLFVPSAFTVPTGQAHWEVLLRARAIENGAFVVAAAQVGQHDDGRETYGHGMVVGPWGEVLSDQKEETGIAVVDLDLSLVDLARNQIPSLQNERPYSW